MSNQFNDLNNAHIRVDKIISLGNRASKSFFSNAIHFGSIGHSILFEAIGTSYLKLQESINKFIDTLPTQLSQDGEPIQIVDVNGMARLIHTEAPKYPNGDFKPFIYDNSIFTSEQTEQATNLAETFNQINADITELRKIVKHIVLEITRSSIPQKPVNRLVILLNVFPEEIKDFESVNAIYESMYDEYNEGISLKSVVLSSEEENLVQSLRSDKLENLLIQYSAMDLIADF